MNRNILKIIAVLTMLIDHIGMVFFSSIVWLRIIGRLAFPIFAFFVAEGMKYTKSRKKYLLTMFLFACLSQIPYIFITGSFIKLNILFTFIFAGFLIFLIEKVISGVGSDIGSLVLLALLAITTIFLGVFSALDYGLLGVLLVLAFYFIKHKVWRFVAAACILILITLKTVVLAGLTFNNIIQAFSLLSLILLAFYNGEKGNASLKYLFYVFYPLHLAVILLIKFII